MAQLANEAGPSLEWMYQNSSKSHRKIAKWLMENPTTALEVSLDELAESVGCSRSTIMRFCRLMGADGFRDLKRLLVRPISQAASRTSKDEIINWTLKVTEETIRETFVNLDPDMILQAARLCETARYILWFGSTESGALAQCAAHKCSLLGMNSREFIDYGSFLAQANLLGPQDAFIAISWGGDGNHLRPPVIKAQQLGMPVVAITATRFSWLAKNATVALIAGGKYVTYQGHQVTIRAGQEALINTLIFRTARARGITWQPS